MKHQRRVVLPCLLVAILCQHHARSLQGTTGSRWVPSSSRIVPQGTPVTARSQLQCAALCMRTVRCYRFCHNTVTLTCFLDTCMPSDTGQVLAEGTKCYDKVMSKMNSIMHYSGSLLCHFVETRLCYFLFYFLLPIYPALPDFLSVASSGH